MAFLIFEKVIENNSSVFRNTNEAFQLAGYNLIYKAWEKNNRPINQGWHVSADELIRLHYNGEHSYETRRLMIDFDPYAKRRIGIIELLDIYAYTDEVYWTPLMLRMRDIFYQDDYNQDITAEIKARLLGNLAEPNGNSDFVEFLYLKGWNWGKNGMTNAVFIQGEARKYFKRFF